MKRAAEGNVARDLQLTGLQNLTINGRSQTGNTDQTVKVGIVGQAPQVPWWQSRSISSTKTAGYKAEFEAAAARKADWINISGVTTRLPAQRFGGMLEIF